MPNPADLIMVIIFFLIISGTSQLLDFYDQILETNFPCCYDDFVFHFFDVFSLDIRCYETLYVGSFPNFLNFKSNPLFNS